MSPILVFDLETIPDVAGIRRVYDIAPSVPDTGVPTCYPSMPISMDSATVEITHLHLRARPETPAA